MLASIAQEGGAFTAIKPRSAGVLIMRIGTTEQRANTPLETQYHSHQSSTKLRASADPNPAGVNGDSTPNIDFIPDDVGRFRFEAYALANAALVGILGGWSVGLFKLAIEAVRVFSYGNPIAAPLLPFIPAAGGVMVALFALPGAFPPGLKGTIVDSDNDARLTASGKMKNSKRPFGFLRKSLASVCTLGTGNSLGPEGPSVEIGMAIGRVCSNVFPPVQFLLNRPNGDNRPTKEEILKRNRLLLSCGAAAGVSAGFNAPLAGVFFALEIVENAFAQASNDEKSDGIQDVPSEDLSSSSITSVLLSSVLSALVSRAVLGNHLALEVTDYTLRTPLIELPLYLLLGATSGVVAFVFSQTAKLMKNLFDGEAGPESLRDAAKSLPSGAKPVIGGLLCGLIGLVFPQILFFGYETLNSLLASSAMTTTMLITLLAVKIISTALCAGSGLVGGTFAPALFLGAMTGASFHNIMSGLFQFGEIGDVGFFAGYAMQLADLPAYAMVGAASVLAALFRAPLTASLLLFELTRDYDVILPLMASAGIGSLVGDLIESKMEREQVVGLRRDKDPVSWGDLASSKKTNEEE
jgi:H+/Cl- antiporter ClcA